MALIDLRERQDEPAVSALIALGAGSSSSAERARERYADQSWVLVGWSEADELVGCVGVERASDDEIALRTVAVAEPFQGRGYGRAMIEAVASVTTARQITAETDDDAVGFYRRLGFTAAPAGDIRGRPRYSCVRTIEIQTDSTSATSATTLREIESAVRGAWGRDTSDDPDEWTAENPALGQCVVTALLVRELLGGEILIAGVVRDGRRVERHAWNVLPSGIAVDLTREQFRQGEVFEAPVVDEPILMQRHPEQYAILAGRVRTTLGLPEVAMRA